MAQLWTSCAGISGGGPVDRCELKGMPAAVLPKKEQMISVIDDDEFVRGSVKRLMKSLGYTVSDFPSAAEFLKSPCLEETACLIADVQMPGMTGIELYRRLMEMGRAIPTILITAYPDDDALAHALNDGVVCYLRKPFREQELVGYVRSALAGAQPREESS